VLQSNDLPEGGAAFTGSNVAPPARAKEFWREEVSPTGQGPHRISNAETRDRIGEVMIKRCEK
jgi:hypothetical protein